MKFKTLLLLSLVFVTLFSSCETNENLNLTITEADLIGTWNVTTQTVESTNTTTYQGTSSTYSTSGYGKAFDFRFIFSEDPHILKTEGGYTLVATVSIPGQQDTTQEGYVTSIEGLNTGNWSLNGNSLTFTGIDNQPTSVDVVQFTGSSLKLKMYINQTIEIFGTKITTVGESLITLEK